MIRPDRGEHKKSGNLRYAFAHTNSAHIVIFDADFGPRADFLAETLPYLDDPGIAIVQTPQFFRVTGGRTGSSGRGPILELFYRAIQVAGTGSARRSASALTRCTGARRWSRGAVHRDPLRRGRAHRPGRASAARSLVYVPVALAAGMCPSGLNAFLRQQYRWCSGASTVLYLAAVVGADGLRPG